MRVYGSLPFLLISHSRLGGGERTSSVVEVPAVSHRQSPIYRRKEKGMLPRVQRGRGREQSTNKHFHAVNGGPRCGEEERKLLKVPRMESTAPKAERGAPLPFISNRYGKRRFFYYYYFKAQSSRRRWMIEDPTERDR